MSWVARRACRSSCKYNLDASTAAIRQSVLRVIVSVACAKHSHVAGQALSRTGTCMTS